MVDLVSDDDEEEEEAEDNGEEDTGSSGGRIAGVSRHTAERAGDQRRSVTTRRGAAPPARGK